jgi:hypothetical protein
VLDDHALRIPQFDQGFRFVTEEFIESFLHPWGIEAVVIVAQRYSPGSGSLIEELE